MCLCFFRFKVIFSHWLHFLGFSPLYLPYISLPLGTNHHKCHLPLMLIAVFILLSSYKYVSLDSRLLILTLVALSGFSPLCLCLSYFSLPMGTKYHKYHLPLREGCRKKNPYFLWSFAKPPLGPPPRYGLFTDKKITPIFSFENKITNG